MVECVGVLGGEAGSGSALCALRRSSMHCFSSSSMRCRLLERAGRVRLGEVKGCFRFGGATVAAIMAVERLLDVPTAAGGSCDAAHALLVQQNVDEGWRDLGDEFGAEG